MTDYLFVCSANLYRSPTAEHVARLAGLNADSAGTAPIAVRPLTYRATERAAKIVCMEEEHRQVVLSMNPEVQDKVTVWNIPDDYDYCDPTLMGLIEAKLGL